jgi:Cof subfamily protein (haloacid dehalogenase superfamily)
MQIMVKMIVMDLDGTLLDNHKNISSFNLSILEKCRARGIKIVIATARSEKSAERCIRLVKPDIMILNGGALIIRNNREIIYKKLLSLKTSDGIINECMQSNNIGDITVETEDGYYVSYKEPADHPDYMHGKYYDFSKPLSQCTYKITVQIFDKKTSAAIGDKYEDCNVINFSNENWCRFAHREAEKMNAVNKISIHEKIDINEIAAFGDDYNDVEMIKGCGIGIAMENGIDEIRKAADYVCKSNNEDGVGKWLEENVIKAG